MLFRARPPRAVTPVSPRTPLAVTLPDGCVVEVKRVDHRRVRGMRLTVTERGIRLTVPPRTSDRRALEFVQQHAAWLAAQLRHTFDGVQPFHVGESPSLLLRDVERPLHWRPGRFLRVEAVDGGIVATLPDNAPEAAVRKAFATFYLAQARADVGRWLPKYLPTFPRAPRSITVRPLTSLWGSLAPDDRMRLDLALVLAPSAAFEYVLVHELCHLIQPNHSAAFWDEVQARCPDWRMQRDLLRARGRPLKAALRAVCELPPLASAHSR